MGIEHNSILVTWGYPITGREALAAELFTARVTYFEKCKKSGRLESWEPVILAPYGGGPAGFFIVRSTHANLQWLIDDTEFQEQNMRALHCLNNFGVLNAFSGNVVADVLTMWSKNAPR
ncbi:MAG TPA: hypothetical protein VJR89_31605 [Polyangiales bacterium]|nr:hypothetical protein [Polyangiales bacterium]